LAKEKAIVNRFDYLFPISDRYEDKYFKYLGNLRETSGDIIEALKTKDIFKIEGAIKNLADSMKSKIFLIGMACLIIEEESLYVDAGFHSYLDYAKHLYEATGLSPQSLSAAKIIMERYKKYYSDLNRRGFSLENNSNKLLYLENALENHEEKAEVFKRISSSTFRDFQAYARAQDDEAAPQWSIKIKVAKGRILVDGKNILNFPEDMPEKEKEALGGYLSEVYTIRAAGNAPLVVETYDESEARVLKKRIDAFLKEIRSKKLGECEPPPPPPVDYFFAGSLEKRYSSMACAPSIACFAYSLPVRDFTRESGAAARALMKSSNDCFRWSSVSIVIYSFLYAFPKSKGAGILYCRLCASRPGYIPRDGG
jgi:hypothetical protein